jgi:hypothetical protein
MHVDRMEKSRRFGELVLCGSAFSRTVFNEELLKEQRNLSEVEL